MDTIIKYIGKILILGLTIFTNGCNTGNDIELTIDYYGEDLILKQFYYDKEQEHLEAIISYKEFNDTLLKHGIFKLYHPNGKLAFSKRYNAGNQVASARKYDTSGNIIQYTFYTPSSQPMYRIEYDTAGNIIKEYNEKHRKPIIVSLLNENTKDSIEFQILSADIPNTFRRMYLIELPNNNLDTIYNVDPYYEHFKARRDSIKRTMLIKVDYHDEYGFIESDSLLFEINPFENTK